MSPLLPGALAALRLPASQHPEGPQGKKNGGGGGVDVIGADAAVSSIMDGDDADRGAKPALRRERNRNGERKGQLPAPQGGEGGCPSSIWGEEQPLSLLFGTPTPTSPPNEPVNCFFFSIVGGPLEDLGGSGFESLRPLDEEMRPKP
ncbi:hypothetical protein mRhiFer1_008071 [Rhinolophus ferrumequinum]|uniref:Uncharacterized protein n=1 Tax=Rhinolophus ferrumequinum TaxID=59479 RepID=A0A7J7WQW9_RHIFE|nr:hypothetical protein mRhiFer1_008071 [Rhinolophus ferrumequinum]